VSSKTVNPVHQSDDWRALSRWSILHFSARMIGQIFGNMYAVVPMLVGALQGGVYFVAIGGAGMVALIVTAGVVRHRFYRYRLDDDKVHIREGFLHKRQLSLEYHRIQNISVEHPFYFRPIGLVTLKVDGAGSSGEEVNLAALTLEIGEDMRSFILSRKVAAAPDSTQSEQARDEQTPIQIAETEPLITRAPIDLILHGITNNRAWVIAGVFAGALGQASDNLGNALASIGIDVGSAVQSYTDGLSVLGGIVAVMAVAAFVILLMAILSILGSLFSYWDYRLHANRSNYLETRGLATRREINMQKSRIQALAIEQNWLDVVIERMHVVLEQISHTQVEQPLGSGNTRIMVPSITFDESTQILQDFDAALPNVRELTFTPISVRYVVKIALILAPVYAIAPTILLFAVPSMAWIGMSFLAVFAAHVGMVYLRYRRWGLAVSGEYVIVRKGLIGIDYVALPAFKIQRVALKESIWTRRRGLASVSFLVASRSVRVPLLDRTFAAAVINYCTYKVESSDRSWM
jgi:putative membrane protein